MIQDYQQFLHYDKARHSSNSNVKRLHQEKGDA